MLYQVLRLCVQSAAIHVQVDKVIAVSTSLRLNPGLYPRNIPFSTKAKGFRRFIQFAGQIIRDFRPHLL